jgi:hypothetical protein
LESATTLTERGVAETIVLGAILSVTQNGVRLSGLFEFIFGFFVSWVLVRMELDSFLPVGLLNILKGRGLRYT